MLDLLLKVGGGFGAAFVVFAGMLYFSPRFVKRPLIKTMLSSMEKGGREKDTRTWEEATHPHSKLEQIAENVWLIQGTLPQPGPKFTRAMTVIRTLDGGLAVHSPVCLNEETMTELAELGEVTRIIVPSPAHRLDAAQYKHRFPNAKVLCPSEVQNLVDFRAPTDGVCEEEFGLVSLSDDVKEMFSGLHNSIRCVKLPSASGFSQELIYLVRTPTANSTVVITCDFFFNLNPETADGVTKFIGSANGFGLTSTGMIMANSVPGLREWMNDTFKACLDKLNVVAILVGHGDPVVGTDQVKSKVDEGIKRLV